MNCIKAFINYIEKCTIKQGPHNHSNLADGFLIKLKMAKRPIDLKTKKIWSTELNSSFSVSDGVMDEVSESVSYTLVRENLSF